MFTIAVNPTFYSVRSFEKSQSMAGCCDSNLLFSRTCIWRSHRIRELQSTKAELSARCSDHCIDKFIHVGVRITGHILNSGIPSVPAKYCMQGRVSYRTMHIINLILFILHLWWSWSDHIQPRNYIAIHLHSFHTSMRIFLQVFSLICLRWILNFHQEPPFIHVS